jgi:hypothetical protein
VKRPDYSKQTNLHLETPTLLEQFTQNLTQFSQGNKLLDVRASNLDSFLSRDTFIFDSAELEYLGQADLPAP